MLFAGKSNPLRRATTLLFLRHLKSLAPTIHDVPPPPQTTFTKSDYLAAINHIANIVRRDIYMERTLGKMPIKVNSELVYRVLRNCSDSGTEALRFFNWARKQHPTYQPTTVEYEDMVRILAKSNQFEKMWRVINQMNRSCSKSVLSHSLTCFVIEEFGRKGLVGQAVEVFNKVANAKSCYDSQQTTEVYNALLFALCEGKMFQGAYALIRRMIRKGGKPDRRSFALLVNAWCSSGKMREAEMFLEEMSLMGFRPPVRGKDLLIDGLLNAGYLEAAKGMVRKMVKEGQLPDVETFNAMVGAICEAGEAEFCVDVYREVCGMGLCPNLETYSVLIPSLCKADMVDEVFRLLHCLIEDGLKPYPSLYAPILKILFKRGQFDDAFRLFSDMKIKGHPPNRPVYTMLIKMCTRGGRHTEAADYLVEMTQRNLVPMSQCFDMVTDGLRSVGNYDLAKRLEQLEVSLSGVDYKS